MQANEVKRKEVLAVALACVLCLAVVAATPSSADAPQVLRNEQPVSEVLTGNAAGAFAFYAVEYAGDVSVATIELRYAPADPVKVGCGLQCLRLGWILDWAGHGS